MRHFNTRIALVLVFPLRLVLNYLQDEYDCELDDVSLVLQAVLLMYEKKIGDKSFWSEYIKLMPFPSCPFYFNEQELKELQNEEIAGKILLHLTDSSLIIHFFTPPPLIPSNLPYTTVLKPALAHTILSSFIHYFMTYSHYAHSPYSIYSQTNVTNA